MIKMTNVTKKEKNTIDEYLEQGLVFPYINNLCVYLDYPKSDRMYDDILDSYIAYKKKYIPYVAKFETLVDFTKKVKDYAKNNYIEYEDLT